MTILYKICLYEERLQKHGVCPIANSISELVFTCLTSLLTQMTVDDEIIFFCDGDNYTDKLKTLCERYTINFHYESTKYINSNETHDQIYVCEDDYLHFDASLYKIKEFLKKYPNYFCHPIDYPNLYESDIRFVYDSEILITNTHHWRSIKSTTYTIAFTKSLYKQHNQTFNIINDYVWDEHGINLLYIFNKCFSPIPSLTSHITNGCIPYIVDTTKTYQQNYNKFNL
jgi:hypothetical protein